jgi:hypothetical protein
MSLDRRVGRLEQVIGERDGLAAGQRAIVQWLEIWRLTAQKHDYLQQHAPHMIEMAEPLQEILEDPRRSSRSSKPEGSTRLRAS